MKTESKVCKSCGFPITSPPRTMKEGFLGAKRIIVEHEGSCRKCGTSYRIKG
jgi:ribosomal protein L37E